MERAPVRAPLIKNLGFKVGLLLTLTAALGLGFFVYVLFARGVFQDTEKLILTAPNAEGVSNGQPLTFSGFPIGTVSSITLTDKGDARIEVTVPQKNTKWLRTSSVFTLEKPFVGAPKIRAFTTNLQDPPLDFGAPHPLLTGDASEAIPELIARVKRILDNVEAITAKDSSLNQSLAHVSTVTGRMAGEYGVMEGVLGGPDKARHVVEALEKANSLLANLNGVSLKVDGLLAKTDKRVYGPNGVMDQADQSLAQVNAILLDVRTSLKKVDAVMADAQAISGNVKTATTDLGQLRTEIDESVRKVNHLINEINRKWPFAREAEVKLP